MDNLEKRLRMGRRHGRFITPAGRVSRFQMYGKDVFMLVEHEEDTVQSFHLKGGFYELEELAIIQKHFPLGGTMLDIGANVGNHGLFAAMFLNARQIVPIEPNPVAYEVLLANVHLNKMERKFDFSFLGKGAGDVAFNNASMNFKLRNIGGGKIQKEGGDIEVIVADDLAVGRDVDFIKIDVEGMELSVLRGLSQTIATHRPPIFVEIADTQVDEFLEWVKSVDYKISDTFRRYRVIENFLIVPNTE